MAQASFKAKFLFWRYSTGGLFFADLGFRSKADMQQCSKVSSKEKNSRYKSWRTASRYRVDLKFWKLTPESNCLHRLSLLISGKTVKSINHPHVMKLSL